MDLPSHLSVVLDLDPVQWHLSSQHTQPLALPTFLSHLLAFLNAHVASKHENSLAVFGAFPGKSVLLYSSIDPPPDVPSTDPNLFPPFHTVNSTIVRRITDELDALSEADEELPCALVGALTKALCYINRLSLASTSAPSKATAPGAVPDREHGLPDPRILVLSVSPDQTTAYIPVMNSIFSAQKLKVTIDACQIYAGDTVFLQQAAHLTNGSYICLEGEKGGRDGLLQYLMMSFLPPPAIRRTLAVPTQDKIDFRAACFCHKKIVDVGFVCSVCLSIFCQPVPVCSTCRTKFPIKTLQRLNASRPLVLPPLAPTLPATLPATLHPTASAATSTSTSAPSTSTNTTTATAAQGPAQNPGQGVTNGAVRNGSGSGFGR